MANRICSIDGCGGVHHSRGWCHKHYKRWRKYGDADALLAPWGSRPSVDGCSVIDCQKPNLARGWCNTHYQRWLKYGDPEMLVRIIDDAARFWAKVEKSEGCWLWIGTGNRSGYGHFSIRGRGGRAKVGAHRFAYELAVGPIPDGLTIDHLCFNTSCVNPDHLEPVSQAENSKRAWKARTIERNSQ